jgi:hypothetical protein
VSKENIIKQCSLYLGKHTTANVRMEGGAHFATIPERLTALRNLNDFCDAKLYAIFVFSSFLLKTPVGSFENSKVDNHNATKFKLVKPVDPVRMKRGKPYPVAVYLSKRLHEINLQTYLQMRDNYNLPNPSL